MMKFIYFLMYSAWLAVIFEFGPHNLPTWYKIGTKVNANIYSCKYGTA